MVYHFHLLYSFRLVGSAHHSELVPSDTKGNLWVVTNAIIRKLDGRSPLMRIQDDSIQVEFLFHEYYYIINVAIECPGKANDEEGLEAHIEGLIAEALLELFGDGLSSF